MLATILKKLQFSSDYLSANYLAKELHVSKRTVQNRIHLLKKEGKKNGFRIQNNYGKGYYLKILDAKKFSDFYQSLNSDFEVNSEKALIINELELLIQRGTKYLTADELAENLDLSKTLVFSKMFNLEKYLNTYGLKLERKSHYGLRIKGSELNILQIIKDSYERGDKFHSIIDTKIKNTNYVDALLKKNLNSQQSRISYYEYVSTRNLLICFIYYKLTFIDHYSDDKDLTHTSIKPVNNLLLPLSKYFAININQNDVNSLGKLNRLFAEKKSVPNVKKNDLKRDLSQFIKQIDLSENTKFLEDTDFIDRLTNHLLSLFQRINKNINYKNPLLIEISVKYPLVFDITLRFYSFLKEKYGYEISNDELGFIALYFLNYMEKQKEQKLTKYKKIAIICTSGGILAEMTRKRILEIFQDAEIKTFAYYERKAIEKFNPNLLLTMVPINSNFEVPTIFIGELLSDKDLKDIKEKLFLDDQKKNNSSEAIFNKRYLNLIKSDLIFKFKPVAYESLLKKMGQELIDKKYAKEDVIKNILIRESLMNTIYQNGIAIPHPIKTDAIKSSISVGIVEPDLITPSSKVTLIFLICLSQTDRELYSSISNDLYYLMKEPEKIRSIVQVGTCEKIINVLEEIEV